MIFLTITKPCPGYMWDCCYQNKKKQDLQNKNKTKFFFIMKTVLNRHQGLKGSMKKIVFLCSLNAPTLLLAHKCIYKYVLG